MTTVEPNSRKEMLVVALFMAGILLPLRFLTITVLGDSWVGALGVLTGVTLVILALAYKRKMGRIGDMIINQITKFHQSKRKWIVVGWMSFLFLYGAFALYTIHIGDTTYYDLKVQTWHEIVDELGGVVDQETIMELSQQMTAEQHAQAVSSVPVLAIEKFEVIAVTVAITNDIMGGWLQFFAMLLVVEGAEVIGIIAISKKFAKKTTV